MTPSNPITRIPVEKLRNLGTLIALDSYNLTMPRSSNIFHRLVANEDSHTELLCNLMQYSAFRRPLLLRILSERCAQQIKYDDIDTQVVLPESGRPDIIIEGDTVYAVVEVKVDPGRGLTGNQPDAYFRYLATKTCPDRWLVFLLPPGWSDGPRLRESLARLEATQGDGGVRTCIVNWHDVLDIIESNDLQAISPFFDQFHQLLEVRFRPKPIVFTRKEVFMLFSKDVPVALSKLDKLIDQIQEKSSSTYKSDRKRSRGLPGDEHGIYFKNDQETPVLWFGVWTDFWKAENIPLCFGVDDKWLPPILKAFRSSYKGNTKSFEGWTLGWVPEQTLASENTLEEIWTQLAPVLQAVAKAGGGASE
jgi:hypothetical protein